MPADQRVDRVTELGLGEAYSVAVVTRNERITDCATELAAVVNVHVFFLQSKRWVSKRHLASIMVVKPLAALPRLAIPDWLHAWALGAPPLDTASRVLVVAYGLIRSMPMLKTTMTSLKQYMPNNAMLAVRVVACHP